MPMKMTFRWYGEGNDRIKLSDIKQIPGVDGIVWALHHKMPGEVWEESEIAEVKRQLDEYGFNMVFSGMLQITLKPLVSSKNPDIIPEEKLEGILSKFKTG